MAKPAQRILITGGSSYLGQHLVPLAAEAGYEVWMTYHHTPPALGVPATAVPLDLRDDTAVARTVADCQPHAIIHLAGSNRGEAMERVIVAGATHIATAAQTHHARLIHLSTDVIFDGHNAPYEETDEVSPLHAYGRAKATAEQIIGRTADHVIVRPSLIYGLHRLDRGTEWMVNSLRAGEPITLFNNQWRMPIAAETLSQVCLELLTLPYVGVLNAAGRQVLSRSEFALRLLDWWQIAERERITIAPAPPDAPWPLDTRLDLTRATLLLRTTLWGVDEILAQSGRKV